MYFNDAERLPRFLTSNSAAQGVPALCIQNSHYPSRWKQRIPKRLQVRIPDDIDTASADTPPFLSVFHVEAVPSARLSDQGNLDITTPPPVSRAEESPPAASPDQNDLSNVIQAPVTLAEAPPPAGSPDHGNVSIAPAPVTHAESSPCAQLTNQKDLNLPARAPFEPMLCPEIGKFLENCQPSMSALIPIFWELGIRDGASFHGILTWSKAELTSVLQKWVTAGWLNELQVEALRIGFGKLSGQLA